MKTKIALLALAAMALLLTATSRTAAQPLMNMEQALSDQAQGTTIAFDRLAFLTGNLGADSFLPPGKVADFSGFQYLRDNDPTGLGHNTDFVTIIARNVLSILSGAQITQMVQRAESQISLIYQYGYLRFPLMDAFRRRLNNTMPAGCAELDWAAVIKHSADLYYIDGLISLEPEVHAAIHSQREFRRLERCSVANGRPWHGRPNHVDGSPAHCCTSIFSS